MKTAHAILQAELTGHQVNAEPTSLWDETRSGMKFIPVSHKQPLNALFNIFREVGPRSKVWTEKEMLEISAWEFAEVRLTLKKFFYVK